MNGNEKIILDAIKNRPEDIKDLSDFDLSALIDESLDSWDRDLFFDLSKEYKNRNLETESSSTSEEELEEKKQEIENEKEEAEASKDQKIDDLKRQLNEQSDKVSDLEKRLQELHKNLESKEKDNSSLLDKIKEAKRAGDQEEVSRLKKEIEALKAEKKALKDKYTWKLPKYDGKDISKLKTKRIEFNLLSRKNIDGQTVLSGPQLMFRNNVRSRKRLNKTIKAMNTIGNDPKKWVNYIISKASLIQWWKIGSGIKSIKNFFTIRDTNKLDEVFKEHKQKFIENLESKMDSKGMSEEDKKTIESIKNRADYYLAAYKRQFITV